MEMLPNDWYAIAALVFMLGMKHGFDADHLATIDGLTRYNVRRNPRLARFCGSLFSLGHGSVVVLIALTVSTLAGSWQVPQWIDTVGVWISISFLVALGCVNLAAVLRTRPGEVVQPVGIRGRLFARLQHTHSPLLVAAVGALFAFSFDTMSQAALFALTSQQFGGWEHALLLALLFMAGMLLTDGVNGLWISRLIRRADKAAQIASRVMGLVVGGVSLLVASFGAAKFFSPTIDNWSDGKELVFGCLLIFIIAGSYLFAVRLARRPALA
ncbi:nickel transporter [Candidatus Accumulibacter phosphatis]|jgi:high-affinity nickel-transport protein|uniref:Nickel/cobalt efflux system n=1 Tax=Candidatus Accumulibacter phosphatis TaxID=327160 RepID=A0ABX1U4D0_9PROT|nr:nickel transporter [Candidatus Accumulibacter phosphatis]NMQ29718.1 nickel transporter [Candidatus Accumulibacter phosphatis]